MKFTIIKIWQSRWDKLFQNDPILIKVKVRMETGEGIFAPLPPRVQFDDENLSLHIINAVTKKYSDKLVLEAEAKRKLAAYKPSFWIGITLNTKEASS